MMFFLCYLFAVIFAVVAFYMLFYILFPLLFILTMERHRFELSIFKLSILPIVIFAGMFFILSRILN